MMNEYCTSVQAVKNCRMLANPLDRMFSLPTIP